MKKEVIIESDLINEESLVNSTVKKSEFQLIHQSWKLTKLKYDITKTEKNILLKIVELCQKYERKEAMNDGFSLEMKVGKMSGKESPEITFPIKEMVGMASNSHRNYQMYKDGLISLIERPFHLPSDQWDFTRINLFEKIQGSEKKGVFKVKMTETFWELFHDHGAFKELDPRVAYKFKSIYTLRMYELVVGNKTRISYSIENIMNLLGKENYTPSDFIKKVVDVAQKELKEMESCPIYFEYNIVRVGRKIVRIDFDTIKKNSPLLEDSTIIPEKKGVKNEVSIDDNVLSEKVIMNVKAFFDAEDLASNITDKLLEVQKIIGVDMLQKKIKEVAIKMPENLTCTPIAYFFGALKKIYEDSMNFQYKKNDIKESAEVVAAKEVFASNTSNDLSEFRDLSYFENKAKLAGISVEECIKKMHAVSVGEGKYKIEK